MNTISYFINQFISQVFVEMYLSDETYNSINSFLAENCDNGGGKYFFF